MEVEKGKERVGNWEMTLEEQQIDCEYRYVNSNNVF